MNPPAKPSTPSLVDAATGLLREVRGAVDEARPAPASGTADEHLAMLWKAFRAAEARAEELERRLAAPVPPVVAAPVTHAVALQAAPVPGHPTVAVPAASAEGTALWRALGESEGRRAELERANAVLAHRLEEEIRRNAALAEQVRALREAAGRVVRVPVEASDPPRGSAPKAQTP